MLFDIHEGFGVQAVLISIEVVWESFLLKLRQLHMFVIIP